jgi:hypothetical protein
MSLCGVCSKSVNRLNDKVTCGDCKSINHLVCAKLNKADLEFISEQQPWLCVRCSSARRADRTRVDSPVGRGLPRCDGGPSLTLEAVRELLDGQKRDIIDEVGRLNKLLEEHVSIVKRQQEVILKLQSENSDLRKGLNILETRVDDLEQYSRRNTCEIHGVPVVEGENVSKVVVGVGKSLNVDLSETDIDACHRIPLSGKASAPGIVVRFVRRELADRLVDARRSHQDLSSGDMGFSERRRVFVNRSLTRARRVLLVRARQAVRDGRLRFAWVDFVGRVKVRRTADSEVILLKSESDLVRATNDRQP